MVDNIRYPIGQFVRPNSYEEEEIQEWSDCLASLPERLNFLTASLEEESLEKTYRPGGWNVAQVIHHMADSHMNGYIRYKWALTESNPKIKTYDQKAFAELEDSKSMMIESSEKILEGLHMRWTRSIKALDKEGLGRTFLHPEGDYPTKIFQIVALYAWHGDHHLAHIKQALNQKS
jgi:DinB superfamily